MSANEFVRARTCPHIPGDYATIPAGTTVNNNRGGSTILIKDTLVKVMYITHGYVEKVAHNRTDVHYPRVYWHDEFAGTWCWASV